MDQDTSIWAHCLEYAAKSDVGLRRANNQDALAVAVASSQEAFQQRGHLFMVADGMGAHAAGELASKIATDVVPLAYHKLVDRSPPEALLAAIVDANNQIHSRGQASPDFKGMGTTSSVLALLPQGALVAHVGDSRAYRLRGNRVEQLSFDHSLVWEMRKAGQIPEEAITAYISKNIITRSLGPHPVVQVDLEGPFAVEAGDTFLLCTDGLSGQVKDEEIGAALMCLPPAEAAQAMIDLANLRGGPDNITIIIARVTGPQVARGANLTAQPAAVRPAGRAVHPAIWTLLGVFALAAVSLAVLREFWPALVCVLAALVTAAVAAVQHSSGAGKTFEFDGRPLGRGPYVSCDCTPNARIVAALKDMVQQLRDAAANENWVVDWNRFNAYCSQAGANEAADPAQAVRDYLHAISFIMAELRRQRRSPGDSSIHVF